MHLAISQTAFSADFIAITGTVTDAAGNPVAGAHVEWGEPQRYEFDKRAPQLTATTNRDGEYRIVTDKSTDYTRIGVYAPGHAAQWLDKMPKAENNVIQADFQLQPPHFLSGVMLDDNGKPVTGVVITVQTPTAEVLFTGYGWEPPPVAPIPGPQEASMFKTGADGRFRFGNLPAGKVYLNFKAPFRHKNAGNFDVDKDYKFVIYGSGQGGELVGFVHDAVTGKPVTGFSVVRRHVPEPVYFDTPDGALNLEGLQKSRTYEIHIYAPGYTAWHGKLNASLPEKPELHSIALEPAPPFRVLLVDAATSAPIPSAPLISADLGEANYIEWQNLDKLVDGMYGFKHVQRTVTGENGIADFAVEQEYWKMGLIVQADGYVRGCLEPGVEQPRDPAQPWVVALQPAGSASGRLVDGSGKPVTEAQVMVRSVKPEKTRIEGTEHGVHPNGDGSFAFGSLSPGDYTFHVMAPSERNGFKTVSLQKVTLASGKPVELGNVVYDPKAEPDFAAFLKSDE